MKRLAVVVALLISGSQPAKAAGASAYLLEILPGVTFIDTPDSASNSGGLTLTAAFSKRVGSFYVGGMTGATAFLDSLGTSISTIFGGSARTRDWMVPLMVTGLYKFHEGHTLQPYVGVGLGFAWIHTELVSSGASNGTGGETVAYFTGHVRPGVEFNFGGNFGLTLDTQVGITGNQFTLVPTFGMHFGL